MNQQGLVIAASTVIWTSTVNVTITGTVKETLAYLFRPIAKWLGHQESVRAPLGDWALLDFWNQRSPEGKTRIQAELAPWDADDLKAYLIRVEKRAGVGPAEWFRHMEVMGELLRRGILWRGEQQG